MYCHPGTNVKDLAYIHVGASEMLHFVTNDEFTICHNRMGFPQEIGTYIATTILRKTPTYNPIRKNVAIKKLF